MPLSSLQFCTYRWRVVRRLEPEQVRRSKADFTKHLTPASQVLCEMSLSKKDGLISALEEVLGEDGKKPQKYLVRVKGK